MDKRKKKTYKRYVYIRDGKECFFCHKELFFKQVSLDHYLPKSNKGSDDIFNLVCSCKRCNKFKGHKLPEDYSEVLVRQFRQAVEDEMIKASAIKINTDQLIELTSKVYKLEKVCKQYVSFQSHTHRFYVKNNNIYKIIQMNISEG